jgi:hypothetical protein
MVRRSGDFLEVTFVKGKRETAKEAVCLTQPSNKESKHEGQ